MDGFSILERLAEKTGGNILHGGSLTVKLLSEETVKKYYDGSFLCKASYSLAAYGKNQEEVLDMISDAVRAASQTEGIFSFRLGGAQGEYTDEGNFRYTVKFSCRYLCGGGDSL